MGGNLTESESLEKCVDDHHICQDCGKPLSQCTCKVNEDEEEVDESLNEGKDSVSKDDRDDIIFRLRKLRTEASEALHKYESLGNLEECRDILYYLVNDSRRLLDFVNDLLVSRKSESLEEVLGERKYAVQYFNKRLSKWITVGTYGNEEEAKNEVKEQVKEMLINSEI